MSLQICAPVSVIRNEKPNNSNNTCPYKTAKVRHLPQQIQSLSAQPPLPNVKHALAPGPAAASFTYGSTGLHAQRLASMPCPARGERTARVNIWQQRTRGWRSNKTRAGVSATNKAGENAAPFPGRVPRIRQFQYLLGQTLRPVGHCPPLGA